MIFIEPSVFLRSSLWDFGVSEYKATLEVFLELRILERCDYTDRRALVDSSHEFIIINRLLSGFPNAYRWRLIMISRFLARPFPLEAIFVAGNEVDCGVVEYPRLTGAKQKPTPF